MKFELKKDLIKHELGDFARLIESQEGDLKLSGLSFDEHLEYLLEAFVSERENRLINCLIKDANFKYPMASIESLDFDARQIKKILYLIL